MLLRSRTKATYAAVLVVALAGLVAQSSYLLARSQKSGLPPLLGSSHDWLLVLAWLGAVVYVTLLVAHYKSAQGLFLLTSVLILIMMALFVDDQGQEATQKLSTRRWGMLHASTLVLGIGAVVSATISALMYLLQHQKLRGRNTMLHRLQLPSLESLLAWNRRLVVASVPMLTVGLVTGIILATTVSDPQAPSSFQWTDPLVIGTIVVWGIMLAALIWILSHRDQTGSSVARLTLLAGGFLLLTVFGLMLLTGGIHGADAPKSQSPPSQSPQSQSPQSQNTAYRQDTGLPPDVAGVGHLPASRTHIPMRLLHQLTFITPPGSSGEYASR